MVGIKLNKKRVKNRARGCHFLNLLSPNRKLIPFYASLL